MLQTITQWIKVLYIERQDDRVLFSQHPEWHYYVIATPEQALDISEGDEIEYEPCGYNFGFFKNKKED